MGLTVKASGSASAFKPVPPGMHLARCYRIIDLGTQRVVWQGTEKQQPKVMIQFEVHSEDADGAPLVTDSGEPMSISKNFTASLGENATLRADLENWRSKAFTREELEGFQLRNVLGAWAMLSVVTDVGNDGNQYTNIKSINPVSPQVKKAGLPEPHNKLVYFDLDNPDMELFETFGKKVKEKIMSSPEWKRLQGGKTTSSGFEDMKDDIPF